MNKKYIGLLDSGVGGLSVLSELYKLLPNENYIYFGDTKNVPYGTKTPEQIYSYTKEILGFFATKNVENVVIACNTTSAVAYEKLRETFKNKLNIFPLIQTAAPYAVENLKEGDTIAILATKATVNSHKYREEINKINPKINVLEIDCTGFVEIVEKRLYNNKESIELIESKLEIVKKTNSKKVVLGCTHYPYLKEIFKKILNVEYFNPAVYLSLEVKNSINVSREKKTGEMLFYASKNPDEFILNSKPFFEIQDVKLMDFLRCN